MVGEQRCGRPLPPPGGIFGALLLAGQLVVASPLTPVQRRPVGRFTVVTVLVSVGVGVGVEHGHRVSPLPIGSVKTIASACRPSHQMNPSTLRSDIADSTSPRACSRPSCEGAVQVTRTDGTTPADWCRRSYST